MDATEIGRQLAEARRAGCKLDAYPGDKPADQAQALAVQDAMVRAMAVPVAGWKVGLTSRRAQQLCGVDQPLAGPVFRNCVYENGVQVPLVEADLAVLEAEIGFRLKADLPARVEPYDRREVAAAIDTLVPMFEWVNKRLPGGLMDELEWIVADGVMNRALVCGEGVAFSPEMDLKAETVRVFKDDVQVTDGVGANALGDPMAVMIWLANDLSQRGKSLMAGDVVATGLICDMVQAEPGSTFRAEFGQIGSVALSVK